MSLPRNAFSFVFMGTLGLSAAVGASSLGSIQTIDFEPETKLEGLTVGGKNSQIVPSDPVSGNNLARLAATIGAEDVNNGSFPPPDINDNGAFIYASSDEPFKFLEATLAGSVFEDAEAVVGVYGTTTSGEELYEQLLGSAGPFKLLASNLKDGRFSNPLTGFGFGTSSTSGSGGGGGGGGSDSENSPQVLSFADPETELLVDDIVLQTPNQVPVPASILFLATALASMGVAYRRNTN